MAQGEGVVLSTVDRRQFFIPHGLLALSDTAEFCYKRDDVYHPGDEGGLMWTDPAIGIELPCSPETRRSTRASAS